MRPRNLFWMVPLALVGLLTTLPLIHACGPDGPSLAFTWDNHPDLPLNGFAAGQLGILQPTYARSYLVVAYRYLTGAPLTGAEREGALALWEHRLQGGAQLARPTLAEAGAEGRGALRWQESRSKFTREAAPEPERFRWDTSFYRPVVSDSALEVAAATLADRARRWPRAWVRDWLTTQDRVFAAGGRDKVAELPLPAGRDALFRQDRAYQVASARFYAGDFKPAREAFSAIALDPASPWRRLAAYLVGRCWLREGTLAPEAGEAARCFQEARRTFADLGRQGLPSRPSGTVPEPISEAGLRAAIELGAYQAWTKVDPGAAGEHLASGLLGREPCEGGDYGDALGRYSNLLDANSTGESGWSGDRNPPRTLAPGLLKNDLTEWVFRFRDTGPAAYALAFARWAQKRSVPWLLMALANGEPASKGIEEVLEAGARIPADSPGRESLAFHRARILAARGQVAEALAIAAAHGQGGRTTPSSLNLWRALRMPLAATTGAFLADALRIPAGSYGLGGEEALARGSLTTWNAGTQATHPEVRKLLQAAQPEPRFIQGDAARILNLRIPTEVLLELSRQPVLPAGLRREWARAAWVRAVLLERWDLAAEATPDLVASEPGFAPLVAGFSQASRKEKEHKSIMALLRHPGLRWMVYQGINRRNFTVPGAQPIPLRHRDTYLAASWWDGPGRKRGDGIMEKVEGTFAWGSYYFYPQAHAMEVPLFSLVGSKAPDVAWLSPAQRNQGEAEGRTLMALPSGPDWLNERTLAWARSEPGDPRLPQALHYAVLAEKVGGEKGLGKESFRLLHSRYRFSPWAARTPIHY